MAGGTTVPGGKAATRTRTTADPPPSTGTGVVGVVVVVVVVVVEAVVLVELGVVVEVDVVGGAVLGRLVVPLWPEDAEVQAASTSAIIAASVTRAT